MGKAVGARQLIFEILLQLRKESDWRIEILEEEEKGMNFKPLNHCLLSLEIWIKREFGEDDCQ